ncbi:allophycocyanin subunit beta [Gloeomargaritales cyanobacterium VI4D9]|nr:allophycocyanin subunit beta [Gloeomargaritales cyanobacterium VI4D9]
MQDTITALINPADEQGQYLNSAALDQLNKYFQRGTMRVKAAGIISATASDIISKTVAKSLLYGDITLPGGNMYPTRRYAACLRDLSYFLRYATYAMLAADASILDERVLNGLKETYTALGVPIDRVVEALNAMKEVLNASVGAEAGQELAVYLDHIIAGLT